MLYPTPMHIAFNTIAIILTLVAFVPYIVNIVTQNTKPHAFSWFIWAITTSIVFVAQVEAEAGVGAWSIGLSGLITFFIAGLAWLRQGLETLRFTDWLFLLAALSSLPIWFLTTDPVWAVVILTLVDLLGFGPTFSKAYHQPFEENRAFFGLFCLRNFCVIAALETVTVTTALFPAAIGIACIALIGLITYRRNQLALGN